MSKRYDVADIGQEDYQVIDNETSKEVCMVSNYETQLPNGSWWERTDAKEMAELIATLLNNHIEENDRDECTCLPINSGGVCPTCKKRALKIYGNDIPF